jgi:hypothetical protein
VSALTFKPEVDDGRRGRRTDVDRRRATHDHDLVGRHRLGQHLDVEAHRDVGTQRNAAAGVHTITIGLDAHRIVARRQVRDAIKARAVGYDCLLALERG